MIIPDQANTTSPIPIYTIVLHDYHTEGYLPCATPQWAPPGGKVEVIDLDVLDDLAPGINNYLSETRLQAAADSKLDGGALIIIRGNLDYHDLVFLNSCVPTIIRGPRGADDDTYDYYPEAVTTMEAYAADLDTLALNNPTSPTAMLPNAYRHLLLNAYHEMINRRCSTKAERDDFHDHVYYPAATIKSLTAATIKSMTTE